MLIFDEIQCGLGRTGTLFAFQQSGIVPDIVTLAKPLGGGLPLGAVLTGAAIEGVVKPGHHGTTFGGNPVACRLGLAVLDEIEESKLLERDQRRSATGSSAQLRALQSRNAAIVECAAPASCGASSSTARPKPVVARAAGQRIRRRHRARQRHPPSAAVHHAEEGIHRIHRRAGAGARASTKEKAA